MTYNDQLYDFLKAVYEQTTPERVYPWIKADKKGRGVLRRLDYAYGFTIEKDNKHQILDEDDNPKGLLRIFDNVLKNNIYNDEDIVIIQNFIDSIEQTCEDVKDVLRKFLVANFKSSNDKAVTLLENSENGTLNKGLETCLLHESKLYRLRKMKSPKEKRILDFFHVPFKERYLMGTYRYSIPGYPSLYCAESIYGAWEEMDRSELNEFGYAIFKVKEDFRLLDLRWRFEDEELINNEDKLLKYMHRLPLIIACSMQVKHSRDKFVPEYVFPQQIFKWLMDRLQKMSYSEEDILGVIYTSNKATVWEELCKCGEKRAVESDESLLTYRLREITNYALLAYLPIDGAFSKYSYNLGSKLHAKTPYWLRKPASAFESTYKTLYKIQNELNDTKVWHDVGEEIWKDEYSNPEIVKNQLFENMLQQAAIQMRNQFEININKNT